MRCANHQKEITGHCQWCGKPLCKQCVMKSHQGKLFCDTCGKHLAPVIQTIQLKHLREERHAEERREAIKQMLRDG